VHTKTVAIGRAVEHHSLGYPQLSLAVALLSFSINSGFMWRAGQVAQIVNRKSLGILFVRNQTVPLEEAQCKQHCLRSSSGFTVIPAEVEPLELLSQRVGCSHFRCCCTTTHSLQSVLRLFYQTEIW